MLIQNLQDKILYLNPLSKFQINNIRMTFNLILIRLDNLEGDNVQGMKKNNTLCSLQTVDFSLFSLTITLTCILVKLTG